MVDCEKIDTAPMWFSSVCCGSQQHGSPNNNACGMDPHIFLSYIVTTTINRIQYVNYLHLKCFVFPVFCLFVFIWSASLFLLPNPPSTSSTFPLGPTVILLLSLWVSLCTLISITRDAMLQNECFEAAEAYVSPSAKGPAKSETTLWKIYIQISSAPHTS